MNIQRLSLLLLVFIFVGCASFKIVKVINSGSAVISEEMEYTFEFEQEGHLIIIPVSINGSDNLNFVVDSGALTVVDDETAIELGLEKVANIAALDTGGGTNEVILTSISNIRIGTMQVNNVGTSVFDLAKVSEKTRLNIDGILGSNILRFFRIIIDYEKKTITFSQDFSPPKVSEETFVLPFNQNIMSGFAPGVQCLVNESVVLTGIIDTGAVGYVTLPRGLVEDLYDDNDKLVESVGVMGGGALTDSSKMYLVKLDNFKIGHLSLDELPASTSEIEFALIGQDLFRQFRMIIDYPSNMLYLEPKQVLEFTNSMLSTGMGVLFNEQGQAYVSGYWKGSPADKSGVRTNEYVLEVNSVTITNFTVLQLSDLFKQSTNPIEIKLSNSEGIRNVVLESEPLLD